jgi:exopolysaccharide production protein ExoZ
MIANIQALRFVAAFWVVLYHAHAPLVPASAMPSLGHGWGAVAGMGFFGVDLFFVISGAVMAESTRQQGPQAHGWRFLVRRLSRIYAGWWPFFLLYLLGQYLLGGLAGRELLGSFLLVPLPQQQYLLSILWTLSLELYFYVVLAALLFLPRRQLRWALLAWGALVLAGVAWGLGQGLFSPQNFHAVGLLHSFVLSPFVAEFVAGFLLCEWLRARPAQPWWAWLAGGLCLLAAGVAYGSLVPLQAQGLAGWFHTPERVLFLGSAACGLVGAALLAPSIEGLTQAWLVRLGDASYALYLCHIGFLGAAYQAFAWLGVGASWRGPLFFATLAAVVAYSCLHHRWVELPLYRGALRLTLAGPRRLHPSHP